MGSQVKSRQIRRKEGKTSRGKKEHPLSQQNDALDQSAKSVPSTSFVNMLGQNSPFISPLLNHPDSQANLRRSMIQAMQITGGNQAAQRMFLPTTNGLQVEAASQPATVIQPLTAAERRQAQREMREFRRRGWMPGPEPGALVRAGTGGGGFSAAYNPRSMNLWITLNIAFTFENGMDVNEAAGTVTARDASLRPSADALNTMLGALAGAAKRRAIRRVKRGWQWSGANDRRTTRFMQDYRTNIQNVWGSSATGIVFQSSRPGWERQLARVKLNINTSRDGAAGGGGGGLIHCRARILKTPENDPSMGSSVGYLVANPRIPAPPAPAAGAGGAAPAAPPAPAPAAPPFTTLTTGVGDLYTRPQKTITEITFNQNDATLTADMRGWLNVFILRNRAPAGRPGTRIDIIGKASSVGNATPAGRRRNQWLARQRARVVANYLKNTAIGAQTLTNAVTRIRTVTAVVSGSRAQEFCRTEIIIERGRRQNVLAHEFGHMIGLDDEYVSKVRNAANVLVNLGGTGGEVGQATGNNALARHYGMPASVYEQNDNLMSLGSTIRPQHYITFMQAIRQVTGSEQWRVKP